MGDLPIHLYAERTEGRVSRGLYRDLEEARRHVEGSDQIGKWPEGADAIAVSRASGETWRLTHCWTRIGEPSRRKKRRARRGSTIP